MDDISCGGELFGSHWQLPRDDDDVVLIGDPSMPDFTSVAKPLQVGLGIALNHAGPQLIAIRQRFGYVTPVETVKGQESPGSGLTNPAGVVGQVRDQCPEVDPCLLGLKSAVSGGHVSVVNDPHMMAHRWAG